jgi:hypothetical protein
MLRFNESVSDQGRVRDLHRQAVALLMHLGRGSGAAHALARWTAGNAPVEPW